MNAEQKKRTPNKPNIYRYCHHDYYKRNCESTFAV
jgi:hypothetical protein